MLQTTGRVLWILVCAGLGFLFLHEIAAVILHPEDYGPLWGGEGPMAGLWYYRSKAPYILSAGFAALWFICGAGAGARIRPFRHPAMLPAHIALTAMWFFFHFAVYLSE